jgi:hypothetical protein
MIAFIDDHRDAHGVERICKLMPIASSTYWAHAARRRDPAKASARARRDAVEHEARMRRARGAPADDPPIATAAFNTFAESHRRRHVPRRNRGRLRSRSRRLIRPVT